MQMNNLGECGVNKYLNDNVEKFTTNEVNTLLEVGVLLSSNLRLEEVVGIVIEQGIILVQAETGLLWLNLDQEHALSPVVAYGLDQPLVKNIAQRYQTDVNKILANGKSKINNRNNNGGSAELDHASQLLNYQVDSMVFIPLISKGRPLGLLQLINKQDGNNFSHRDLRLCNAFASQAAVIIDNSMLFSNQEKLLISLIKSLTSALDARDPYTKGHSERVSKLSLLIGQSIGLENKQLEIIQQAALLHDVGKIGICDNVLLEPGPLDDEKWQVMKSHPEIGAKIIEQIEPRNFMHSVWEGVMFHQEKYDGSGYPQHLKGADIPLVARIIAIADAYDAMTSDRPYRKGLHPQAALNEIRQCSGTHFDPDLADSFLSFVESIGIDNLMEYLNNN
jgi:HD-GYP domain-containing protein (c-di-GMP phosphodiesterase class II)